MALAQTRPIGSDDRTVVARCRICVIKTRQFRVASDPRQEGMRCWRCGACDTIRISLADCDDFEAMVRHVLDEHLRKTGANVEYFDALQAITEEGWELWSRWDPSKGVPFLAYAVGLLRLRVANYYRKDLGRTGQKAHANALSLDAVISGTADGETWQALLEGGGDPSEERSVDLARILSSPPRNIAASRSIASVLAEQTKRKRDAA